MKEDEEPDPASEEEQSKNRLRVGIIVLVLAWTFCFNLLLKGHNPLQAFFSILDTISDDFVIGATATILFGVGIVVVFSLTKLYTQIISNVYSFRILEELVHTEFLRGRFKSFWSKVLHFEDLPQPATVCPARLSSLLMSFSFIYVMSWIYVVLFSEALFFVSWSAGVDLPIDDPNKALLLPTIALAIPFSARVMAYVRYPYTQDYADFVPGAVFVLLLVAGLGLTFGSDDQRFFLKRMYFSEYWLDFLRNGAYLAFIPVFFEAAYWLIELGRSSPDAE